MLNKKKWIVLTIYQAKSQYLSGVSRHCFSFMLLLYTISCIDMAGVHAGEVILPASEIQAKTVPTGPFTYDQVGDVDIPECNSVNLGYRNTGRSVTWTITSELGSGSTVYPGREWKVTAVIDRFPPNKVGNDGVDPLRLQMTPTGPVVMGAAPVGSIPKPHYYIGDKPFGLIGEYGAWGFSFDGNSSPTIIHANGDGVSAKLEITLRADAVGTITLPKFNVEGYDASPIAGQVNCDPMPVGFFWNVVAKDSLLAELDTANTDARYNNIDVLDQTTGPHTIRIDVLANDDDPNEPGGPGDLNQIRIASWSTNSLHGGTVSCGTVQQNNPSFATPFANLSTGPCVYTPPLGFSGKDNFSYFVRGANSTQEDTKVGAGVFISVVQNTPPQIGAPVFGTASGVDKSFDLAPYILDSDTVICIPDGNAIPAVGTATVLSNCTIDWDNTDPGFTGNVIVPFKVCDHHNTLQNGQLGANTSRSVNYSMGDITPDATRRCTAKDAVIAILTGLKLPPTGVGDSDVVDAGYAVDGVGAYTLRIPVLDNDTDGNGPNPSLPSAAPVVLTGPAANEGIASFDGDKLVFTPADEFSGTVNMTYRVCEDPATQSPPYFDDPNTPIINEGLPICGVGAVSIEVLGNLPPVAGPDETAIADNFLLAGFDLGINDSDPDGDPINCTAGVPVSTNPGLVETVSVSANCKLSFNPVDGQAGVVEFTYEVCDQHILTNPAYPANPYGGDGLAPGEASSRCSTGTAIITVSVAPPQEPNPNDADPSPVCLADFAQAEFGVPLSIDVIVNDSDLNAKQVNSAVILTGPPADQPLITVAGGSAKMDGINTVLYTPPGLNFQGVDSFSYTARDTAGQGCSAVVTITVSGGVVGIPTLNSWSKLLLLLMMTTMGMCALRRKQT